MVKLLRDVMKLIQPATTVVVGVIHGINANLEKILMFYGIVDQPLAIMVMILNVSSTFMVDHIPVTSAVSIRTVGTECLNVFHR